MTRKRKARGRKPRSLAQQCRSGTQSIDKGWSRYALTAELLSDIHPGSGSGGTGIDALFSRDRYDRPVIWASHVEGVFRDAARRLRGEAVAGDFFGRPGGQQQRTVFTSLYACENSGSHIWRSSAREGFDNRAPKDDTLRVIEYVPKGTKFVSEIQLPVSELPLLQRLVQEVDALGSGRANNAGSVRLTLEKIAMTHSKREPAKTRLTLILKSRDPLCITATASPDNIIPSLSYVPGRTLLGALAAWLIAEGDRESAARFTAGHVSVSDALPLPATPPARIDSVEVLPAPLSLQSQKPEGFAGEGPWWAQPSTVTQRRDALSTTEKLRRPEDDLFVIRTAPDEPWTSYCPKRRVRLRNGRPDPQQADTSLFAVEQIVEETYFLAELQGTPEDMAKLADKLEPILEGRRWLRVGRSGGPIEVAQFAWNVTESDVIKDKKMTLLTLTSDLLLRDDHLRWQATLDEKGLCMLFHTDNLRLVKNDNGYERVLQDSVKVHGFNGTSRLWRMPATAIRRGSVFAITGDLSVVAERLANRQWLGERTHEGFGRFRLDGELPGVTGMTVPAGVELMPDDAEGEAAAATTWNWFNQRCALAVLHGGAERKPSLSQWIDLVVDLGHSPSHAIIERLNPTTSGAKPWRHTDAEAILKELNALAEAQRIVHARYFVRWLRAAMRREVR